MINLTQAQQNIVKSDSTVKNFRVHFPNGENTDLTNDDIVFETVKFTESVCSEQTFRFGCAEASVIEFETVGVQNIIGMTIECSMTFTLEDESVTIPYGVFVVESCPRDHKNMTHRKARALSKIRNTNEALMPQMERDKLNCLYESKDEYVPNVHYLLDSMHNSLSTTYTSTEVANRDTGTATTGTYYFNLGKLPGTDDSYSLQLSLTHKRINIEDSLYTVAHTYDAGYEEFVDTLCNTYTNANKGVRRDLSALGSIRVSDVYQIGAYKDMDTMGYVYPYINLAPMKFSFPYSISAVLYRGQTPVDTYGPYVPYPTISFTKHDATGNSFPLYLAINHTLETALASGKKLYSFTNAYTIADIETGYAELHAGFNRRNRDGSSSIIQLDNSTPYPLTAADVDGQAWWDEYSIADIGSIKYCWADGKGEHEGDYTWDTSGSVYDMSSNGLLKNIKLRVKSVGALSSMTDPTLYYIYNGYWYAYDGTQFAKMTVYESKASIIQYMLDTFFIPYADIHFTPIDMDIRGLPFLQCGDAITFTSEDNVTIHSYILNHTFSGIQYISENMDTVQGEVLT